MTNLRVRVLTSVSPTQCGFSDDAVIRVDADGRLADVAPYDGRAVDEDLRTHLLVPGFVDAHVHYPQTRVIGRASGPLLSWLEGVVFPEEARFKRDAHAEEVAELFCDHLARAGTTLSFVYSSVHPSACDILFRVLEARGMRAIAGPVLMDRDCPTSLQLDVASAMAGLEELHEKWHGDLRRLAVIPRFALSCSEEMLREAAVFANAHGLHVSTHISENETECELTRERFSSTDYLEVYERAGLIHDRCILAHCVHLSESEWDRMRDANAIVAHCPDSNLFLGSGRMPTRRALARDLRVCVGTDVAAGRTFSIREILACAYDNARAQGVVLPLETLFYWGTRGGALALGVHEVGQIAEGMDADMTLVSLPEWVTSKEDCLGSLLFDRAGSRVERTWVKGREVFRAKDR